MLFNRNERGAFSCLYYPQHEILNARQFQVSERQPPPLGLFLSLFLPPSSLFQKSLTNTHASCQEHLDACHTERLLADASRVSSPNGSSDEEDSDGPFVPSPPFGRGRASVSHNGPSFTRNVSRGRVLREIREAVLAVSLYVSVIMFRKTFGLTWY